MDSTLTITAEHALQSFVAEHHIALQVDLDADDSLTFGRDDDGRFVLTVSPDRPMSDVLSFACTVIARHEADRRVAAVMEALMAAGSSAPGFAELVNAFVHSAAWHLNATGEFVKIIENTLASLRREAAA